jgi:hypothetical protein
VNVYILLFNAQQSIFLSGKMIDKKPDGSSPKLLNNSSKAGNILNNNLSNNATGGSPPSPTPVDVKSTTLFKKVSEVTEVLYQLNLPLMHSGS